MKKSKFKELIYIAEKAVNLPDIVEVRGMEVDKSVYLSDDVFNPVVLVFANFISRNLCGKDLFNLNVIKSEDGLCFASINEDGEDDSKDEDSDALRVLVLIESLHSIFDLKHQKKIDLTHLVVNWRRALTLEKERSKIDPSKHIKMLIMNNMEKLSQMNNKNNLNKRNN